ncbi:MAG TPA: hypothetical protein V6D05_16010 [Stenomitos sp.]
MHLRSVVIACCLFLAGCAATPSTMPSSIPSQGHSLLVRPYLTASRLTQSLVPTRTVDDIDYMVIIPLFDPGDGQFHTLSKTTGEPLETFESEQWDWSQIVHVGRYMPWIRFDQPIQISGLKAFGRYRIQALAYDRAGRLLSQSAGSASSVDLTLADDDTTLVETPLPVQLMDTPFGASFNLTLSPIGDINRLESVTVTIKRVVSGSETVQVATYSLQPFELLTSLRVAHLNAQTRYVVDIEPHVVDGGPAPASQSLEVQVDRDDELPQREAVIELPAL